MDFLRFEVKAAVRALRRRPAIAVAAVLTLSLAIAATTAVFTVVDAVTALRME
jgi:hypothetical protein